jgi:hypothetical protein
MTRAAPQSFRRVRSAGRVVRRCQVRAAVVLARRLVEGTLGLAGLVGWAVAVALFLALSRSKDPRLPAGVATFAWIVLTSEFVRELSRGVPAL